MTLVPERLRRAATPRKEPVHRLLDVHLFEQVTAEGGLALLRVRAQWNTPDPARLMPLGLVIWPAEGARERFEPLPGAASTDTGIGGAVTLGFAVPADVASAAAAFALETATGLTIDLPDPLLTELQPEADAAAGEEAGAARHNAEIGRLRRLLEESRTRLRQLDSDLDDAKGSLVETLARERAHIHTLTEEKAVHVEALAALEQAQQGALELSARRVGELEAALASARSLAAERAAREEQLSGELAEARAESQRVAEELRATASALEEVQRAQVEEVAARREMEARLADLEALEQREREELAAANENAAHLEGELESASRRLTDAGVELAEAAQSKAETEREVERLRAVESELSGEVARGIAATKSHETAAEELNSQIAAAAARADSLEAELRRSGSDAETLTAELESQRSEAERLRDLLAERSADAADAALELERLRDASGEAIAARDRLSGELASSNARAEAASADLLAAHDRLGELGRVLDETRAESAGHLEDAARLQARVDEAVAQSGAEREERERLEQRLAVVQEESQAATESLTGAEQRVEELEQALAAANAARESLDEELPAAQTHIASLEADLEAARLVVERRGEEVDALRAENEQLVTSLQDFAEANRTLELRVTEAEQQLVASAEREQQHQEELHAAREQAQEAAADTVEAQSADVQPGAAPEVADTGAPGEGEGEDPEERATRRKARRRPRRRSKSASASEPVSAPADDPARAELAEAERILATERALLADQGLQLRESKGQLAALQSRVDELTDALFKAQRGLAVRERGAGDPAPDRNGAEAGEPQMVVVTKRQAPVVMIGKPAVSARPAQIKGASDAELADAFSAAERAYQQCLAVEDALQAEQWRLIGVELLREASGRAAFGPDAGGSLKNGHARGRGQSLLLRLRAACIAAPGSPVTSWLAPPSTDLEPAPPEDVTQDLPAIRVRLRSVSDVDLAEAFVAARAAAVGAADDGDGARWAAVMSAAVEEALGREALMASSVPSAADEQRGLLRRPRRRTAGQELRLACEEARRGRTVPVAPSAV